MEIVTLLTNRYYYDIVEAADASITVRELIERLSEFDPDEKVVFSNDNGYTYGYITDSVVTSEEVHGEEDEDPGLTREDQIADIVNAIRKNGGDPIPVKCVYLGKDFENEVLTAGFRKNRLGVALDNGTFLDIDELTDDEVDSVWFEGTQIRR